MEELDVPVLIVGAGVAGMAVATTLARYGLACLLVERRREPAHLPRATVISTRCMELLRAWGLDKDVIDGGVHAEVLLCESETLASAAGGRLHPLGMPTRAQAAVVSPNAPEVVPQDWLEQVLRRHVNSLDSVRVQTNVELGGIDNRAGGVRATLRNRHGEERTISARYLVAADGAHSATRRLLGVRMSGPNDVFNGVQAVFRAPLWSLLGQLRYALYYATTSDGPGTFLPAGRGDRWVYGMHSAAGEPAMDLDEEHIAERIRLGAGVCDLPLRIERIGAYSAAGQVAERFRVDSAFLVGDAAHRVTPRGGTGMNAALQSAYDLAWKLAWVLRGWSGTEVLDSYEAERRLVAEHNVARSTDPGGSRRRVEDELHIDLGGRLAHAWLPHASRPTSTLDLLGLGWTLLAGPADATSTMTPDALAARAPIAVRRLDALTARAIGIREDGAILARPDGVPTAMWSCAPHDAAGNSPKVGAGDFRPGQSTRSQP